jgi:hypothetical protein
MRAEGVAAGLLLERLQDHLVEVFFSLFVVFFIIQSFFLSLHICDTRATLTVQ